MTHQTLPTRRAVLGLAAGLSTALGLSACGRGGTGGSDGPLRVGVNPVPHGEILTFVRDELAKDADLEIEVVEFTDYVQPNEALDSGDLDANYFQHQPYLDEQEKERGYDFTAIGPVHLEPLGVYSEKVKDLKDIPEGGKIAIPNDPSNAGRALLLLQENGVLKLKDTGKKAPTRNDVESGPEITELEAAQLPRSLGDVDAAVINGNYAIEADLSPVDDALAIEDAKDNPYANLLVVRTEDKDDERLTKLAELLASDEVKGFIKEKYDGTVVPAA